MLLLSASVKANVIAEDDPNIILRQLALDIHSIYLNYEKQLVVKQLMLTDIKKQLKNAKTTEHKIDLLILRDSIDDEIVTLIAETDSEISKVRYLKGLQIIKILYEKVLSLDHHFTSVRTLNEINKLSNPNQYPEYSKLKDILAGKRDKRNSFDLSSILAGNTIVSIVQTITNMVDAGMSKEEKEKQLASVECILDFTLRMQNDLNTIYFETAFLHTSNDKMKQDIEVLFKEYAKPIGYTATLDSCRTADDWEALTSKMEEYIAKMKSASGQSQYKMKVNFDFPIDRLLLFISQYNSFIDQGGKFYEKFRIILNSYENGTQCEAKLPTEYIKLKSDIDIAIEKFNVAYKPVEINGTKMKEILYGLNEFE
ncbi:MAG TPA: hypothetical protein VGB44_06595 [Flavobacterium sp.]|jgi:hypothetical protein